MLINNEIEKGYRLNQKWYFNKDSDTVYYGSKEFNIYDQKEFLEDPNMVKRSIFVRFKFFPEGDTLNISEPFRAFAEDAFPFWKDKGSESYVVLAKEKYNFNIDFSNEHLTKCDTFFNLEHDKQNVQFFPNADKKHSIVFGRWFDTPGEKILRGYMVEYYKKSPLSSDNVAQEERRTYFEKKVYVIK